MSEFWAVVKSGPVRLVYYGKDYTPHWVSETRRATPFATRTAAEEARAALGDRDSWVRMVKA
jgi:hypothetical protein